jgi:hypothetical protein
VATRLVHVVIDALDVERLARFWARALRWHLLDEHLHRSEGVVRSQWSGEPVLEVITVPTTVAKSTKNRVHLDLTPSSEDERLAVLDELAHFGAQPVDIGQGDVPWDVLADPDGNEFCVTAPFAGAPDRLGAICVDANDIDLQVEFWTAASGWAVEARWDTGAALRHPSGRGPALTMGPPVAPKHGKARIHLDIAPPRGGAIERELDRLIALGATECDIGQGDVEWSVLQDPEGNEFCILTAR